MAVLDHRAELNRAGANATGFFGTARFLMRRYPLGAIGALIDLLFVLTALLAPGLTVY
jgi:peptide/nickel transport system permease protein